MEEVRCKQCPLRRRLLLSPDSSAEEVELVPSLKRRELRRGATRY